MAFARQPPLSDLVHHVGGHCNVYSRYALTAITSPNKPVSARRWKRVSAWLSSSAWAAVSVSRDSTEDG